MLDANGDQIMDAKGKGSTSGFGKTVTSLGVGVNTRKGETPWSAFKISTHGKEG